MSAGSCGLLDKHANNAFERRSLFLEALFGSCWRMAGSVLGALGGMLNALVSAHNRHAGGMTGKGKTREKEKAGTIPCYQPTKHTAFQIKIN